MPGVVEQDLEQRPHVEPRRGQQRGSRANATGRKGAGASQASPERSTTRRTSEKPLECTPDDGKPKTASPGFEPGLAAAGAALGRPDGETREVKVARRVEARHLRRFAADQRAARLRAAFRYALDDRGRDILVESAGGKIVQKQERLRALNDDVVDAHRNQIDADRVVDAALDRDLHLGADAVIGGDQNRIDEAGRLEIKKAAKSRLAPRRRRVGASLAPSA